MEEIYMKRNKIVKNIMWDIRELYWRIRCKIFGHLMVVSYTPIEDESNMWKHDRCIKCFTGISEVITFKEWLEETRDE
jgi:hypothetical protein